MKSPIFVKFVRNNFEDKSSGITISQRIQLKILMFLKHKSKEFSNKVHQKKHILSHTIEKPLFFMNRYQIRRMKNILTHESFVVSRGKISLSVISELSFNMRIYPQCLPQCLQESNLTPSHYLRDALPSGFSSHFAYSSLEKIRKRAIP